MSRDVGWTRPRDCLSLQQDSQRPRRHQYVRHSTVRDILEENMTLQLFPLSNAKLDDDFNPFNKILNDTDTQIKWRSGDQKTASFG